MKYKLNTKKIKSIKALNDYQGLGEKNAKELQSGKAVEITKPPEHLVKDGFIIESKGKGAK